jgi:hypothetical protein
VLVQGGSVDIRDSHIHDISGAGVVVMDPSGAPVVRDSVFERTGLGGFVDVRDSLVAWPVIVRAGTIAPDYLVGNRGTGNRRNGMLLSGTVAASGTLLPGPDQWVVGIGGGAHVAGGGSGDWQRADRLTLGQDVRHPHLAAGLVVKAMTARTLDVGLGTLAAEGTAERPVTITGWTDDTAAGDTDRGDTDWFVEVDRSRWAGILGRSSIRLAHTRIAHAAEGINPQVPPRSLLTWH